MEDADPPGEREAMYVSSPILLHSLNRDNILTNNSTARNATSSPLLRLPAELRNKIYAYVLTGPNEVYSFDYASNRHWLGNVPPKTTHPVALIRCCRQVDAEAKLLPFELNLFRFSDLVIFSATTVGLFLPVQRAAITRISITGYLKHPGTVFTVARMKTWDFACARALLPRLVSVQLVHTSRASDKYLDRESNKMQLVKWLKGDSEEVQVTEKGSDGVLTLL
ncbi:hypothetical protein FB567DRAFT_549209 [Paraphoma chrysanthemicola]|uniref:Uncharacterized protein n=1 Tax=Paraphoma chrysanthemicola TaxID=798071 RepID=A0A8K0R6E2_9PLEO|nr:hypothetical protein FB567DRAFT_549209 [Paraphoma chrysanthemicola]